ncbi:MAG: heavy metal-responsive transcriptional regulator [Candidatus Dadabacteria bacterium]|nr:MAG: heavy metal-responsive transcriptional regulator [Candidatus Dadabacteria bacterium]
MGFLRIGELAKRAGVNLQTIYYYERRGLLPAPPRVGGNYRAYPPEAVARVRFIRRAQQLGFTLSEIEELLSLRARPRARCREVYQRAERKLVQIDEKIRALRAMRKALVSLMSQCQGKAPASECPILDALEFEEEIK